MEKTGYSRAQTHTKCIKNSSMVIFGENLQITALTWPWTVLLSKLREEKCAGSLSWAAMSQRWESRLSVSPRWQLDECDGMNFTVLATSEKLCCQTAADNRRREESNKSAAQLHVIHSERPQDWRKYLCCSTSSSTTAEKYCYKLQDKSSDYYYIFVI